MQEKWRVRQAEKQRRNDCMYKYCIWDIKKLTENISGEKTDLGQSRNRNTRYSLSSRNGEPSRVYDTISVWTPDDRPTLNFGSQSFVSISEVAHARAHGQRASISIHASNIWCTAGGKVCSRLIDQCVSRFRPTILKTSMKMKITIFSETTSISIETD